MKTETRSRAVKEGWQGRRRTYKCRECDNKFQVDTLSPLPIKDRFCPSCLKNTIPFTFINRVTSKEYVIRASDAELATLRAWKINSNLTFKEVVKATF